jgi:hypothetical protein
MSVSHLGTGSLAKAMQRPKSLPSKVVVETGTGVSGGVLLEQFGPEHGVRGASCGIGSCGLPKSENRAAVPLECLTGSPQEAIVRAGASESSASKGIAPCQISKRLTLAHEATIATLTPLNLNCPGAANRTRSATSIA